jgi:nitrogen-specific signal transduction histidine kinase
MHDADGKVIGVLTTYEDITERKQMEQYVLHTERLAAMGRLAAALAHEINNPLHAISNGLELVLDFPLESGEQYEYLQAALREIERLAGARRTRIGLCTPAPPKTAIGSVSPKSSTMRWCCPVSSSSIITSPSS